MHEFTIADHIWNRACQGGGDTPGAGDSALSALLLFHGVAMNGGVLHALETLSLDELAAAQNGYRYFGFGDIADLIAAGQAAIHRGQDRDLLETKLDQQYSMYIPEDETVVKAFEEHYKLSPDAYSSLPGDGN